jgi:hypothetical protein
MTPSSLPEVGQIWVANGAAGLTRLPLGASRRPLLATRAALRFQASSTVALLLATDYGRDPNRTQLIVSGTAVRRAFAGADSLTVAGGLQARF